MLLHMKNNNSKKLYRATRPDGSSVKVTVPESDRSQETLVEALHMIDEWSTGEGELQGMSQAQIGAYVRAILKSVGEA